VFGFFSNPLQHSLALLEKVAFSLMHAAVALLHTHESAIQSCSLVQGEYGTNPAQHFLVTVL